MASASASEDNKSTSGDSERYRRNCELLAIRNDSTHRLSIIAWSLESILLLLLPEGEERPSAQNALVLPKFSLVRDFHLRFLPDFIFVSVNFVGSTVKPLPPAGVGVDSQPGRDTRLPASKFDPAVDDLYPA
jgi:hypothetical protein